MGAIGKLRRAKEAAAVLLPVLRENWAHLYGERLHDELVPERVRFNLAVTGYRLHVTPAQVAALRTLAETMVAF